MAQHGQVLKLRSCRSDGKARWAYRYRVDGSRSKRPQVGGFATRDEAERALTRELGRLRPGREIPLAELVEEYLKIHQAAPSTIEKLRWLLSKATAAFGDRLIDDLRSEEICAWRCTLPEGHRFEATQALRQVLNAAVAWELIDVNPARRGVPNPLRRFPEKRPFESWQQIRALASKLDAVTGPMVVFGAATGLRPAELLALEQRDIDRTGGVVYVRRQLVRGQVKQTKTRRSIRAVPLQSAALDALDRLPETNGPLLFPAPHGGHIDLHNFRPRRQHHRRRPPDLRYWTRARTSSSSPRGRRVARSGTSPATTRTSSWDSPWGPGAPGWHLECSVMSMKYLGKRFDVHTGGVDHIPVHHTNEIAQSEAYLGGPWVPFWLHNEFINLREAKMSKSKSGTLLLSDLEQQGFHPLTYRLFLLGSHYRNQTEFTWRGLEGARVAQRRLLERLGDRVAKDADHPLTYEEAAARLEGPGRSYLQRLDEAISTDLNTAQALAALTQVSRDPEIGPDALGVLGAAFEAVLAVGLLDLEPEDIEPPARKLLLAPDEIDQLLGEREDARRRGDFAVADEIRDMLERLGIEVRDTPDGTVWKVRPAVAAHTAGEGDV